MSNFLRGTTFQPTGNSADALYALVEQAQIQPDSILNLTEQTAPGGTCQVLAYDPSVGALRRVQLANVNAASSVRAAHIYPAEEFVFLQVRIQTAATGLHGWNWQHGGNGLLLQETNATGGPLSPAKIPLQILEGTQNNTLYTNATGLGVLNATPAYPLDVTGTARATKLVVQGAVPMLALTDNSGAPYYGGLYMEAGAFYFSQLASEGGAATGTPFAMSVTAPSGSFVMDAAGSVGLGTVPSFKLDVAGSLHFSDELYLGATGTATSATLGTKGQLKWDASFLYVCTASGAPGTWKKVALTAV